MALFLGCLQYALEEGPRWDWLADETILAAVVVSSIASVLFFWRVLTYHQPIVDLRAFTNPQFRGRLVLYLRGRHRPLRRYLPGPAVSRAGARLQQLADRRDGRRHRARANGGVAVHRLHCPQPRSAHHAGDRHGAFCRGDVPDRGTDQSGGLCRAAGAAGAARRRTDVLLSAGQSDRARHLAAGQAEELRRALQSDARSRRCDRAGDCS